VSVSFPRQTAAVPGPDDSAALATSAGLATTVPGISGMPGMPAIGSKGRIEALLIIATLVVGALVLNAAANILPDDPLIGPITPARLLLAAALAALVAAGARPRDFRTALDVPIVLLVAATALATVGHTSGSALRFLLTAVAFYYLTVGLVRHDPQAREALPLVALVAVVAAAAVGLAQVAQATPTTFYRRGLFGPVDSPRPEPGLHIRATGTFPNPNLLATFVLLLGPYAALPAVTARRRSIVTVSVGLVGLAAAGLFVSYSRAAIIGALAAAAVAWLVVGARGPRWRPRAGRAGAVVLAAAAVVLLIAGLSGLLARLSGRREAFTLATRALRGHLARGVGPRRAGDVMNALGHAGPPFSHAHNLWLNWLLETGVVGFAAIVLITLGGLVVSGRTALAGFPLGVAGLASLTGFCLMSLVDDPANAERISMTLWFVLGLTMVDTVPGRLRPRRGGARADSSAAVPVLAPRPDGAPAGVPGGASAGASAGAPGTAIPAGGHDLARSDDTVELRYRP
jgi:O-antigen ligase